MEKLIDNARRNGAGIPHSANTAYLNTIPVNQEPKMPGNRDLERKIKSIVRWNAQAMVLRASRKNLELGGHIASFQSSATLYDVGFNHFFKAPNEKDGGDLVFYQGHISPGIYSSLLWKADLVLNKWTTLGKRHLLMVFLLIPILSLCQIIGNFQLYQWDLVQSKLFIKQDF